MWTRMVPGVQAALQEGVFISGSLPQGLFSAALPRTTALSRLEVHLDE
jgi:hypothetical protein